MQYKSIPWIQITVTFQTIIIAFGFLYTFSSKIDYLALFLFVFYMILLVYNLRKNRVLLQMVCACMAYMIVMPFLVQSSDQKYMFISRSGVIAMEMRTFWIFLIIGILMQLFYWILSTNDRGGRGAKAHVEKTLTGSGIIPIGAFLVFYTILYFFMGFEWMLSRRQDVYDNEITGIQTLLSFCVKAMPSFIGFVIVEQAIRNEQRPNLFTLAICYLLLLVFNNPVNTPRFLSLGCMLIPMLPYFVKKGWIGLGFVMFPIATAVLLPLTSLMRGGLDRVNFEDASDFLSTGEFSAMLVFNDAMRYLPSSVPSSGNNVLSAFLAFVPRSIWPTKNSGTGIEAAESMGYIFTNVGMPPVYDFYLDFGYFGIVIFSFVLALATFKLQKIMDTGKGKTFQRSCPYIIFIAIPIFLRGDFSTASVAIYALMSSAWIVMTIYAFDFSKPAIPAKSKYPNVQ